MTVRILIVDDMAPVREGLRILLGDEPEVEVVGEADTAARALALVPGLRPDAVLLDIEMPDSLHTAHELKALNPPPLIIALTVYGGDEARARAISAGADLSVDKSTILTDVVGILREEAGRRPALAATRPPERAGGQPQAGPPQTQSFIRFIRKIALGLVAFVPAARSLAADLNQVVEKFVKGRVVETASHRIVVETPERGEIIMLLSPAAKIWDGGFAKDFPFEGGDQVTAWVTPRRSGVYEVEQLWVNWISFQGRVLNLHNDQTRAAFACYKPDGSLNWITIDPRTQITTHNMSALFADLPEPLHEGEVVQVTGRRLKDGSVLATQLALPDR